MDGFGISAAGLRADLRRAFEDENFLPGQFQFPGHRKTNNAGTDDNSLGLDHLAALGKRCIRRPRVPVAEALRLRRNEAMACAGMAPGSPRTTMPVNIIIVFPGAAV